MAESEHVHLYDRNIPFKNCSCPDCQKHLYVLDHKMKPLDLPDKLVKAIEVLLWYSPNNRNSYQSYSNKYLKEIAFDNAVMTYFMRYMGMKSEDICYKDKQFISQSEVSLYLNKACASCQKIIVVRSSKSETIIKEL